MYTNEEWKVKNGSVVTKDGERPIAHMDRSEDAAKAGIYPIERDANAGLCSLGPKMHGTLEVAEKCFKRYLEAKTPKEKALYRKSAERGLKLITQLVDEIYLTCDPFNKCGRIITPSPKLDIPVEIDFRSNFNKTEVGSQLSEMCFYPSSEEYNAIMKFCKDPKIWEAYVSMMATDGMDVKYDSKEDVFTFHRWEPLDNLLRN